MKKIFESHWNIHDESGDRVYVYEIENDDEFWEIEAMNHKEKCEYFNVFDESGYDVAPGAVYYTYDFYNNISFVTMYERKAFNV